MLRERFKELSTKQKIIWFMFGAVVATEIVTTALDASFGISGTVRVPTSDINIAAGISFGRASKTERALTNYLREHPFQDDDLIASGVLNPHIRGAGLGLAAFIGSESRAPGLDLRLVSDKG